MKNPELGKSPITKAREKLEAMKVEEEEHRYISGVMLPMDEEEGEPEVLLELSQKCPLIPGPEIVILKREESSERLGVLFIPTSTAQKSRPLMGRVLAVGKTEHWKLSIGDTVIFYEFGMTPLHYRGIEYVAVKTMDVICRVTEPD